MLQNKYQNYLLITVFIALISFPLINSQLTIIKDIESKENRKMASAPEVNISYLDKLPGDFNAYYSDNFSIRSIVIKYYNKFTLDFFKKSPIPDQLVIGKDNWLFLGGYELASYRGQNSLTKDELEKLKKEFEYRKAYLEKQGCHFYLMVAPIKASIYSDKMPDNIFRISEKSWGEQLTDYMNENSDVNTINLYPVFKANKDKFPLYYKLDNHWNPYGAQLAANEFFNKVHANFKTVESTPIADYTITSEPYNGGNIVQMLNDTDDYTDTNYTLKPKNGHTATLDKAIGHPCIDEFPYCHEYEIRGSKKTSKNPNEPKLLIISDSFGGSFFPFAVEQFGETVKIFDSWQYKLNEEIVTHEKPDIEILIMLESNIRNLLRHTSCPDIKKAE